MEFGVLVIIALSILLLHMHSLTPGAKQTLAVVFLVFLLGIAMLWIMGAPPGGRIGS